MAEINDKQAIAAEAQAAAGAASQAPLHIGIDVGSTTVKVAVLDDNNEILYSCYRRHHADIRATIVEVVGEAAEQYPATPMTIAITGSGGLLLAQWLGIDFVQEVIASKTAVETFIPQTDVVDRARRRRREDHLLRQWHRTAHERHLRRRHGRVHRPNGGPARHRRWRPERARKKSHHHLPHREPLRRVRQDRRAAAFERRRPQRRHRGLHFPGRRNADHFGPRMRPSHSRQRRLARRPFAVPL